MIIDTSALVAMLKDEPQKRALATAISAARVRQVSAATLTEAGIVMQGQYGDDGARRLDALLLELDVETIPVTAAQAAYAREAFRRFGKGQHPVRLNLGDCFAYALARAFDAPVLFVSDDFGQTDIAAAPY